MEKQRNNQERKNENKQYRINVTPFEIREVRKVEEKEGIEETKKEMIIEGYAVVFDKIQNRGWLTEVIEKGAFDDADMSDVCLRYNHSTQYPILARTRNKSLSLEVDDIGLKVRSTLIETTDNRNIYEKVKAGLLDKMSFAFYVEKRSIEFIEKENGETDQVVHIEKIKKVTDVAIVDEPFYEDTSVSARGLETVRNWIEEETEERKRIKLEKEKLLLLLQ